MLTRLEDAPMDETLATGVARPTASLTLEAQKRHEQRKRQFGG